MTSVAKRLHKKSVFPRLPVAWKCQHCIRKRVFVMTYVFVVVTGRTVFVMASVFACINGDTTSLDYSSHAPLRVLRPRRVSQN